MGRLTRGERVIRWIEKHCVVPEGAHVGRPVVLRPFQRDIIRGIYDNPAGTRRAIISVGRKNAKSALSAFLLLVHLAGPEHRINGQLFSAAQSREQASVIFKLAAKTVRLSPTLREVIVVRDTNKELLCPELGTVYRALSADAATAFGLSPVLVIYDEAGQIKGERSDLFDALETATGAQEEPLSIIISTQAPTDADLLSILIDDALASNDPKIKLFLYTAPMDADPFAEETIRMANPAFGDFQNREETMQMAEEAKRMPSREASWRNLILNQRVEVNSPFIPRSVWEANGEAPIADWTGRKVYGGLDLSEVNDLTSLVLVSPQEGKWDVKSTFWLPSDNLIERALKDRVPYDRWAGEYLDTVPGASIDYDHVARHLREEVFERYDVEVIAFDRWNWRHFKPALLRAGFSDTDVDEKHPNRKFEPFGQGFASMSPALRTLEAELLNGNLRHGKHPVLSMCAANAVVKQDDAGSRKLVKAHSRGRIDGMIALTMAMAVASEHVAAGPSVYEERGFLDILIGGTMQTKQVAVLEFRVDATGATQKLADLSGATEKLERQSAAAGLGISGAAEKTERAWQNVQARLDPVFAAQIKMQRELERVSKLGAIAQERLGVSHADVAATLSRVQAHHEGVIAALQRETAITQANTAALSANANASKMAAYQRRNLMFQLNDVAVSLAGGMNPMMVAMQQGSQIATIYEGGVMPALRETGRMAGQVALRFWPIAVAAAAGSTAIAGMRHEINETSKVQVGFGDVALAVWQSVADGIYQFLKPAIDAIGGWFSAAWDWTVTATKNAGNAIIRAIVGAIEYVKTSVASLPAAFIAMGEAAAQGLVDAITAGVNQVIANIDTLVGGINAIAGQELFGKIGQLEPFKVDIGGAKAAQDYANAWKDYANTVAALNERDIMGEWFGDIQQRAIANATAKLDENEKATRRAGKGAEDAAKQSDAHRKALEEQAKAAQAVAESIENALGGALQSLFDGPITSLDDALDGILSSFAQLGNSNLNAVFNGLFSQAPTGGQHGNGFWGSAIFDLEGAVRDGARAGTEGGIFEGLGSLVQSNPKMGAAISSGLGGLGIGYQTQDPLMGGLGGALQGLPAMLTGNPLPMIVGAAGGRVVTLAILQKQLEEARRNSGQPSTKESDNDRYNFRTAA